MQQHRHNTPTSSSRSCVDALAGKYIDSEWPAVGSSRTKTAFNGSTVCHAKKRYRSDRRGMHLCQLRLCSAACLHYFHPGRTLHGRPRAVRPWTSIPRPRLQIRPENARCAPGAVWPFVFYEATEQRRFSPPWVLLVEYITMPSRTRRCWLGRCRKHHATAGDKLLIRHTAGGGVVGQGDVLTSPRGCRYYMPYAARESKRRHRSFLPRTCWCTYSVYRSIRIETIHR